ncbi:4902_t:CDS:2, partial [Gigaspora rosea]
VETTRKNIVVQHEIYTEKGPPINPWTSPISGSEITAAESKVAAISKFSQPKNLCLLRERQLGNINGLSCIELREDETQDSTKCSKTETATMTVCENGPDSSVLASSKKKLKMKREDYSKLLQYLIDLEPLKGLTKGQIQKLKTQARHYLARKGVLYQQNCQDPDQPL